MAVAQYNIERLDATNYSNWCSDIKYILIDKGCWDIIDELKVCPPAEMGNEIDIANFKKRSDQALATIYLNINPDFRKLIESCDSPTEAWKKLKNNFCPDSRSHHMKLFSELMESRIERDETVGLFASRILRLGNRISEINDKFDFNYVSFQLLRYLPAQFDGIVQTILRWEDKKFQFNDIVTELCAEETRLAVRDRDRQPGVEAQMVRTKSRICWSCGRTGHVRRSCPNRYQGRSRLREDNASQARSDRLKGFNHNVRKRSPSLSPTRERTQSADTFPLVKKRFQSSIAVNVLNKVDSNSETRENQSKLSEFRFIFPEFLPDPKYEFRNKVREKLERSDMLKRRSVIYLPEFYVGSILAVTATDPFAPGKQKKFVGICIYRTYCGLRATFTLRNIVDNLGVEIMYDMYNPTILSIEVLRLEKRLDNELFYLRDAAPEYSTFPFDMEPEYHPEGETVPVNPLKVKLKPPPWHVKWEQRNMKGIESVDEAPYKKKVIAKKIQKPWEAYDLMKEYRRSIPEEDQVEIWEDVDAYKDKFPTRQFVWKKTLLKAKPK